MFFFFFQAEDGIRDLVRSRGLGDVYKRQGSGGVADINWERDWKDHAIIVKYEDIVGYKAVLCLSLIHI